MRQGRYPIETKRGRIMPTPRPKHFAALSGLRCLAAVGIVVGHWQSLAGCDWITPLLVGGTHIVSFFFVLSGFVLCHAYARMETEPQAGRFLLSRFGRVYPVHIACLALAIALVPRCRHNFVTEPGVFLANLFLLQSWMLDSTYISAFNPPSWSISSDLFCYLFFPLLIRNWRATWLPKLGCAFVCLAVVVWLSGYLSPLDGPMHAWGWDGILCTSPLVRLFEFVMGMTLYFGWSRLSARWRPGFAAATCLELLAVALVLAMMWQSVRVTHEIGKLLPLPTGATAWLLQGGIALPTNALLIGVMAFQGGLLARILSARLPVFLGEMSYSTYMVHYPLLLWWLPVFGASGVSALLCFLAILTASYLLWVLVENPSRKLRPRAALSFAASATPPA
jgi:peptidoglycan/LPS O-acetylase OafA/YrhL